MAEPMKIDGQCQCGHVAYRAVIDPDRVAICHCTDCQQFTGSPYRVTVVAARDDVELTAHAPKLYTKRGESGAKRLQYFCGECGSPLFTTGEGEDAAVWGIRWGSVRQREALVPKKQKWCRSMAPWLAEVVDLPASPGD